MLHLEMTDLDLHPGDHKLLLEDDDYAMYDDSEFEDESNMTFFDNIRYFFLVCDLYCPIYNGLCSCIQISLKVVEHIINELSPNMNVIKRNYTKLGNFLH